MGNMGKFIHIALYTNPTVEKKVMNRKSTEGLKIRHR